MAEEQAKTAPAAYLPFKTFISSVEALEQGLPKKLDRTIWRSQSGVIQSQIMMAFRFFGLVNEDGEPTAALQRMIGSREKRQEHIGALLRHAYRDILDHDLTKMTPRMLEEAMGQYNVSGDTRRKAIGFFLRAARFADIPMHPLLASQIRETGSGTRKKRAKNSKADSSMNGTQAQMPPPPPSGSSTKTIALRSGGAVSVEIAANPFLMSPKDRTFVFELIDMLHTYAGTNTTQAEAEKED